MRKTKVFIHFNLFTGAYYAEDFFLKLYNNFKFMNCSFQNLNINSALF